MKLVAVAATAWALTSTAIAAPYTISFSGADAYTDASGVQRTGVLSRSVDIDVQNGFAVSSKNGQITGDGIGSDVLVLITSGTKKSDGTFTVRSNAGDDIGDNNNAIPLTTHNILFGLQNTTNSAGQQLLFGLYRDADGGSTFSSFLFGTSQTQARFYENNGQSALVSVAPSAVVSSAPEPGSWALMLGGVSVLGAMLRVAQARRREDEVKSIATASP